jgi:transposase
VSVLADRFGLRFDRPVSGLEDLSHGELIALVRAQEVRIAELVAGNQMRDARIAELTAANEGLAARLAKLEHLLSRNSGNSSSPPSKDEGPGRTPPKAKSRREPGRGKGKQKGAPGSHLSWSEDPDDQIPRFPQGHCECGGDLADAADLGIVDRYQQTEIPQTRARVTQYDQHAVRCGCGKVHTATRPEGARSGPVGYGPNLQAWVVFLMVVHHVPTHRCVQVLEALTGAKPSVGFVHGLLARVAAALSEVDARIRALITLVHVLCMDETPIRVGPKKPRKGRKKADMYLLVACTSLYTHYLLGDRDLATFKASVLKDLTAGTVVVHDRYVVYDNPEFAHVVHQLCCQHLLRDLADAGEVYPDQCWPAQIADALRGLIHATNLARQAGHDGIDAATREKLLHTLRHGVLVGLSATTSRGTRPGENKARLLLEVFRDRPEDILRFVTDLAVPPTSNDAERGLRPSKIQQNVSGRLTSVARTKDRYRILGYVATAAQHGHDKMRAIRDAVLGHPWTPELPAPT